MPAHNFARPQGRLVEIQIHSSALVGNLLGDPTTRTVTVYLPPGYDGSDARYPLFVDLVGFTGSGLSHLNWKPMAESVPVRVDRLVAEGKMGPVILAFPDCYTSLGGNQYIDSAAMGAWARFLVDEMLPELARQFRVEPGATAVFGKSSGGYGAMVHAMLHPEAWQAAACHSGDMAFDLVYLPDMPKALNALAKHGGVEGFLEHVKGSNKVSGGDLHTMMTLAMAATYDPDPDAPAGVRLPVDPHTCALDRDAWARWQAHDPVHMVERGDVQANLRRSRGLWIDCGDRDQYHLHYGSRQLSARLEALDIPHHYAEFPDNHSGIDYRMDLSLPWLYAALTSDTAP